MPQSTSSPTEPRPAPGRAQPQQSGVQEKTQARTRAKGLPKGKGKGRGKPQAGTQAPGDALAPAGGWVVYLLRCVDGTLYCGCTNDLERRLGRHRRGDVKYTRGRLPVEVAYCEAAGDRGGALRREAALKRLPRGRKLHLCAAHVGAAKPPGKRSTRDPGRRAGTQAGSAAPEKRPGKRRSAAPKL